jgi:small subunit ribosomal protein S16
MGRKKHPTYRIVVAEITSPRDGKYIEAIGHYEPKEDPAVLRVDREKALKWIGDGATASDTVRSLLKKAGVFEDAPAAETAVAPAATTSPAEEAPTATNPESESATPAEDKPEEPAEG